MIGNLEPATAIASDVCIVGSGPAGWTIAEELRDSGLQILVSESGGADLEPESEPKASAFPFSTAGAARWLVPRSVLHGAIVAWLLTILTTKRARGCHTRVGLSAMKRSVPILISPHDILAPARTCPMDPGLRHRLAG